jgi:hypothetical protein
MMGVAETITVLVAAALGLILGSIVILTLRSLRSGSFYPLLRDTLKYLGILGRVAIGVLLLVVLAGLMGPFGIIWWGIVVFICVEGARKYRMTQQYGLLWLLTISAERSMPLTPAIEAFARERRGSFSRRAKRLAQLLDAGVPLPDALDRCRGLLPRYAAPMVRVGYETGTLAPALRQAATFYAGHEPVWAALVGKITYLLMLPVFGALILIYKDRPFFRKDLQRFQHQAARFDAVSD